MQSLRTRILAAEYAVLALLSIEEHSSYTAIESGLHKLECSMSGFDFAHWAQMDLPQVLYSMAANQLIQASEPNLLEMSARGCRRNTFVLTSRGLAYRGSASDFPDEFISKLSHHFNQPIVKST